MHKRFDHTAIEKKWQDTWRQSGIYDVTNRDNSTEKSYVLVEWPYPSGNLHIGHWYAFAVPDIYVRYLRMQGKQVLYPMGFDAFGLPAENAAIKRNVNPREWTDSNMAYMRTQLDNMGNAFSWNLTCNSTDPEYYKWTQWMFTQFFENNIAYRGEGVVNWCPGCNTVIANEQVLADDTCERSGDTIEKRRMPQWMLRITDFADALVDDLDALDWPEFIKESQRNWIGRSKGAEIDFVVKDTDSNSTISSTVTVFTTRPDTLFGATYLVLAPEHPLIAEHKNTFTNYDEVAAYVATATQKDEQDRLDATKEKTGVKLEGVTAINPGSGEAIPIYVADYVIGSYGTGAIMAVPAHDERDNEFANKFKLPIKRVVFKADGQFRDTVEVVAFTDLGTLINSGEFDGMDSEEAKEAIVKKVGGRMTNTYRLRDWSVGRQRYWGVPIPIVYDPEGKAHPIPEEHLPWTLPEDVDFKPTGEAPLAKSQELKERTVKIFGAGWTPEVETMDTFVDSSWYFLRYIDNDNSKLFSSLDAQNTWLPIDTYFGGAEHTTMHVLYARFWQKALHKLGLVSHSEPFKRRFNRGQILGPDGQKMSKSKGNVVDPDEHVTRVGADTVKMYLAFMGPYGELGDYPFDLGGIAGIRRFLERVYGLREHVIDAEPRETTSLLHKTIKKIDSDITQFKFNTAISALMIFINHVEKAGLTINSYHTFIQLLAPFAPHLCEELWAAEGMKGSIHTTSFPQYEASLATDTEVTIGVQINGRMRGSITIAPDANEEVALATLRTDSSLVARIEGKTLTKVIYVPGRILNLIVTE